MPAVYIPYEFITHTRRVKSLYKKVLRDIEAWNTFRHETRIQSVLIRQKFEENRNIKDPIKARQVLKEAENKFEEIKNPDPIRFPTSYLGTAFERTEVKPNDQILDFWHPLEKAQYPDYFARREQRKKEFIEWYDKKYGRPKWEVAD